MMHVFDTNVLSEVMKDEPHPSVTAWLRSCPIEAMFTTAASRGELLYGIRRLPEGARRARLERAAHRCLIGGVWAGDCLRPAKQRNRRTLCFTC